MNLSPFWNIYFENIGRHNHIKLLCDVVDRGLQALPITQHDRLWEMYLPIIRIAHAAPTAVNAYSRFLKIHPEYIEDACEFFLSEKAYRPAAHFLTILLEQCLKEAAGDYATNTFLL